MITQYKAGLCLILVLCFIFYGIPALGQQTFYNVPNSHISDFKEIMLQSQTNIQQDQIQMFNTAGIGLGKGFEIGINYNRFTINTTGNHTLILKDNSEQPLYPLIMLNGQKAFYLRENMDIAFGIQAGFNTIDAIQYKGAWYAFINYGLKIPATKTWFSGGLYSGNNNYMGEGTRLTGQLPVGIQAGVEQFLFNEKFTLIADIITGRHDLGSIAAGAGYDFHDLFNISVGYQIPLPNSQAEQAILFQMSYNRVTKNKSFRKI